MPAMDDAAERAARSARELARRTGSDRHDVLLVLGSGLTGRGRDPRRRRGLAPARHAPLLPPLHGGRPPRPGLVRRRRREAGPGLRRPVPPVRGDRARRGRAPPAHGRRRRLHDGRPDGCGRGHPGRPHDRGRHGGRGPPQPDGSQPPERGDLRRHESTPTRPSCSGSPSPRRARVVRWCHRAPASTRRCRGRSSRRRRRSACCAPRARTSWACPWRSRPSPPGTPAREVLGLALVTNAAAGTVGRRHRRPRGHRPGRRLRPHPPWPTSCATS